MEKKENAAEKVQLWQTGVLIFLRSMTVRDIIVHKLGSIEENCKWLGRICAFL